MAKRKNEEVENKLVSKKEKLLERLLEERKMAEKNEESLRIGKLSDFYEVGRENYAITGLLGYDLNVGGVKRGTINVLYGAESSGKTTTALNIIEGIQMTEPDAITLYVDSEGAVDEKFLSRMPYLNQENIFFIKEGILEKAFDKVIEYANGNLVDYIIIDSIDSLYPSKELEKDLEEVIMMESAKIISRALPQLQDHCRENNLTVFFIQQVRTQFKGAIAVEGRSGGKAMRFYPATVVKLSNLSAQNEEGTRFVKIKNEKSKIGNPYMETYSFINISSDKTSIDRMKECLNYACECGIIEKKGAWVYIPDENGEIVSYNGIAKAFDGFKQNIDLYSLTKLRVYGKLFDHELFIVKFEEIVKYLKKENELMKNKKVSLLKALGKTNLINENDYKSFELIDPKPEDYMDEEEFKKASFQLMTLEEQEEYLKKITPVESANNNTEVEIEIREQ